MRARLQAGSSALSSSPTRSRFSVVIVGSFVIAVSLSGIFSSLPLLISMGVSVVVTGVSLALVVSEAIGVSEAMVVSEAMGASLTIAVSFTLVVSGVIGASITLVVSEVMGVSLVMVDSVTMDVSMSGVGRAAPLSAFGSSVSLASPSAENKQNY